MLSFHIKFVQIDRLTDRQTDRRTMVKQYAPDLSIQGHKNSNFSNSRANNSRCSGPIRPIIELIQDLMVIQGFFFTKKVTPIIGIFPSANFPQEKYFSQAINFSPGNQFSLR